MFEKIRSIYKKIINVIKSQNTNYQLETLDYNSIIKLMKEKGTLQEFENELNNFDEIEELMRNKTSLHGINHIVRVLFNAYAIITLEKVNDEDKKIIIEAAKLHDIGRVSDGEDEEHGNQSAIKARKILENKGFSTEQIDEICFIIKEHSLPRSKNNEDIEKLPEEFKQKYRYCLNLLKDADKLDRVRIGDLDPQRLSTDSAKRLIHVAEDIFENNRYYYKKKMKIYPYDKKEAEDILKQIKEESSKIDIDLDIIKKNYSIYKAIQEQGKIEWLKIEEINIPLNDLVEIVHILSKEDMEYIENRYKVGPRIVIQAIYAMGIDTYMQLKTNQGFNKFMYLENYAKAIAGLTPEEKDLILEFRKYDIEDEVANKFYLYYHFIKNNDEEKINMLLLNSKDKVEYMHNRTDDPKSGYKWIENMLYVPTTYEMIAVKKMDTQLTLDIREKLNIPLNVMITAMLNLGLLEQEIERNDLEKILLNYHKLNLNIIGYKDNKQVINVLLSLPEKLSVEDKEIIRECTIGRLKRFNLENFEQIKNYKQICDEKILQEFQKNDDVNELRKLIFETKIKDIEGIRRDIYFYKKYMGEKSKENEIFNLFEKLLESQDKEELLQVYSKLNDISLEFEIDDTLDEIRKVLSDISKEDVVLKMNEIKEKIQNAEIKNMQGQAVVDLTGTDFNLLISVIGGSGSPYLVKYYNEFLSKTRQFHNKKAFRKNMNKYIDFGIKRLVNKRYKIDPLKNKQRCVSSIDQDFIGHIKSASYEESHKQIEEKLILAYFPQEKSNISCMGNQDLMTIYDKDRKDPTRKRIPHEDNMHGVCNLKLEDLNNITMGDDNELVIDSYPGAIMCFDKISEASKNTAKKIGVPILYIDTKQQFKIMKRKIDEYYSEMQDEILQNSQISSETFQNAFNVFDNNIIHTAFKMANSFTFLDDDEYPKEQIIEIFDKMKKLVDESLKRCDLDQRKMIQSIMLKNADINNLRYGQYSKFINFKELINMVSESDEIETVR